MSTVVFDISMSLDGFVTAANRTKEEPLGPGGQVLDAWARDEDDANRKYLEGAIAGLGAVITGRDTYDTSLPWWGPNGPSGSARRPVFVVTHNAPVDSPDGGVYTFVTDGIESALRQAKAAADGKYVTVMGGASTGRQYIAAGLVDEISIHLVPVLLGSGTRMFEHLDIGHVPLEPVEVIDSSLAVHLRLRVVNRT
jgi:dihydrofolate reductase